MRTRALLFPPAWSAIPTWPLLPPALLRPQLQHAQGRRDCGVDHLDTLWVQAGYRGCSEYALLDAGGWGLAHSQRRLELSSVNLFLLHKTTCPWESGLWAYCGIVWQLPPRAHPPMPAPGGLGTKAAAAGKRKHTCHCPKHTRCTQLQILQRAPLIRLPGSQCHTSISASWTRGRR